MKWQGKLVLIRRDLDSSAHPRYPDVDARKAVRDCPPTGCPLWSVRPYQVAEEGEP